MIFYFMDSLINKVVDGVLVASYAPPGNSASGGAPFVIYAVPLPDGSIIVLGAIEDNLDGSQRTGVVVDSDLNVVNDQWNPSSVVSEWFFSNGDVTTDLGRAQSGAGAAYDSVTDRVYLTEGSIERSTAGGGLVDELFLVSLTTDGDLLDSAISSLTGGSVFVGPGTAPDGEGTSIDEATRKLYYLGGTNAQTVVEYDLDTGDIRWSECFAANRFGHLEIHPVTGDLWLSEKAPSDASLLKLCRFAVDTIPWGTGGVETTPDEEVVLFDEDTGDDGPLSDVSAFCFIDATTVLYQAFIWASGNAAWFQQTLGGSPELVLDLGSDWFSISPSHEPATQVWVSSGSTWPLHVVTADGTSYRVGPDSNPDGGLLRLVEADGTRWVQSPSGAPMAVVGPDGTVLTTLPMIAE